MAVRGTSGSVATDECLTADNVEASRRLPRVCHFRLRQTSVSYHNVVTVTSTIVSGELEEITYIAVGRDDQMPRQSCLIP